MNIRLELDENKFIPINKCVYNAYNVMSYEGVYFVTFAHFFWSQTICLFIETSQSVT